MSTLLCPFNKFTYRRAVFIPQLVGYLLQGLALLAHGVGKFSPLVALLVALLKQPKRHALTRSLEVQRRREAQLKRVVLYFYFADSLWMFQYFYISLCDIRACSAYASRRARVNALNNKY